MRSVVVVLPASMWAMIPMLRVRPSGYSRMTRPLPAPLCRRSLVTCAACATVSNFLAGVATRPPRLRFPRRSPLPPVVGERAVRLCHLVDVLAPLHGVPLAVGGIHDLGDQPVGHRVLSALPAEIHQPPEGERRSSGRP